MYPLITYLSLTTILQTRFLHQKHLQFCTTHGAKKNFFFFTSVQINKVLLDKSHCSSISNGHFNLYPRLNADGCLINSQGKTTQCTQLTHWNILYFCALYWCVIKHLHVFRSWLHSNYSTLLGAYERTVPCCGNIGACAPVREL